MSFIPHLERVTRNSTISHFLLMLGYKLFSFYFPIFLLTKGLTLPQVGFIYLLIYLPIAIFSPLIGMISHKLNPYALSIIGITGYGLYSLGMLTLSSSFLFYFLQIILGISASLFFVSNRIILMSSNLTKPARSFGWFYSAPYYAAEFAPAIGALIIFLWGFTGVFAVSIAVYFLNILYTFFTRTKYMKIDIKVESFKNSFNNMLFVVKQLLSPKVFPIISLSLVTLFVAGFYQAFFLISLKKIGWSQNEILFYSSLFSVLFLPISFYAIHILSNGKNIKNIFMGSILFAIISILFGLSAGAIGFIGVLILMEIGEFGGFIAGSARSGFISKLFNQLPKEVGSMDTIFSPLGTAFGSLAGGLLIGSGGLSYSAIFIFGGIFILILSILNRHSFDIKA